MTKSRGLRTGCMILSLFVITLLTVACGTLEIGVEPDSTATNTGPDMILDPTTLAWTMPVSSTGGPSEPVIVLQNTNEPITVVGTVALIDLLTGMADIEPDSDDIATDPRGIVVARISESTTMENADGSVAAIEDLSRGARLVLKGYVREGVLETEEVIVINLGTTTPEDPITHLAQPSVLHVAFAGADGNVFLWREGEEAVALTNWGGASRVKISDDGTIVAFERGGDLWMVRSDGTDERQLISADDLEQAGVSLYRFEWVPGTHTLAFNTSLNMDHGLALNDDLRLVNADTLEQTFLLPSGEGGEFYYSPDGSQVAISTGTSSIVLYDADGDNQRLVQNYTPVSTASEFKYYAQPVWATDSSSLRVAIPPPDPYVDTQLTSIFHLGTDDGTSRQHLMGTLEVARMSQPVFSPDFSQAAYLQSTEGDAPGVHQTALAVANLDQYIVGESTSYYPEATLIYGWSPDSNYFAFLTNPQQPTAMIGQAGVDPFPAFEPEVGTDDSFYSAVIDVTWVDDTRYLFLAMNPRGWDILLGELFTTDVTLVGFVPGAPPRFDFAY